MTVRCGANRSTAPQIPDTAGVSAGPPRFQSRSAERGTPPGSLDVPRWMYHDFPRAGDPARAVQVGMLRELRGSAFDFILQLGSGDVIALGNVLDDGGQVDPGLDQSLNGKH